MILKAKFDSKCPHCNLPIRTGDTVVWERGQKTVHEVCPTVDGVIRRYRSEHPRRTIEFVRQVGVFHIFRTDGSNGPRVFAENLSTGERLYPNRRDEITKEIEALELIRRPGDRWDVVGGSIYSLRVELDKYVVFDEMEVDC